MCILKKLTICALVVMLAKTSLLAQTSVANGTIGSLVAISKNGSIELEAGSLAISCEPEYGFLDEEFNYTSVDGINDSYGLEATTPDGKTILKITVFVSPSTGKYTATYVGSATNYPILPGIELTDVAGLIDGDLVTGSQGWELPVLQMDDNLLVLGSNSGSSEGVFVFQGALNQERANDTIEGFARASDSFLLLSDFSNP